MGNKRGTIIILIVVVFALLGFYIYSHLFKIETYLSRKFSGETAQTAILDAQKTPDYTFVFVGDSMTEFLGNFDELRGYLKKDFPNKQFLLLNYGFGSTNILSLPERILKENNHAGRAFQPINDIPFKYIFIESFGNNPLSAYPLEEGLQKQNEALDKTIAEITQKHPVSSIVFVATVAPNKNRYGEGTVNLSPDERVKWANERIAYIKNHIKYASDHHIPIVNIFDNSMDSKGNGNTDYISTTDFIHPSPTGVYFISQTIEKFIYQNHLLDK